MPPHGPPIRVLHIDDEPDITPLTAHFLERAQARLEVSTPPTPPEGLTILQEQSIECVSDYDMPGHDGITFLKTLRTDFPDLPFILYTGCGSDDVASTAIAEGATKIVKKETATTQYTTLANHVMQAIETHHTDTDHGIV